MIAGSLLAVGAFFAMEAVSAGTHRWLMHGAGMRWHRSHHGPASPGWEANDVFPLVFSVVGFGVFLAASLTRAGALYWIGGGITAYGMAYLFVHEVYIHRRVPVRVRPGRYLEWVRRSHRVHHAHGGAPFGMLLPVVPKALRDQDEGPAARLGADGRLDRRESTRSIRERL